MSSPKPPCPHQKIERTEPTSDETGSWPAGWFCLKCNERFLPEEMVDAVEQKNDDILDTVTAVFSATLWDLHERAFATHGIPHAQDAPLAEAVCEEKGHDRGDDGVCKRCGHDPFLGGTK